MACIFNSLTTIQRRIILYRYINTTSQLYRITNIPSWYFDRVVFSGQKLMFEVLSQARLSINHENDKIMDKQHITVCISTINTMAINKNYTQNKTSYSRLFLQ